MCPQSPGLLTSTIEAIVKPRKASRETSRPAEGSRAGSPGLPKTRSGGYANRDARRRGVRIAPLRQELRLARLRIAQVPLLHVAIATDELGDGGDLGRERDARRIEFLEKLAHHALIVGDELSFRAPFRGVAEDVERRAAQETQPREHPHRREHPRSVLALARLAGHRIGLRPERRREVHLHAVVALELAFDALQEVAVGMKARDLVFVLVRHELEEIARDDRRELRRAAGLRLLGRADLGDEVLVALRVGLVLVAGEE